MTDDAMTLDEVRKMLEERSQQLPSSPCDNGCEVMSYTDAFELAKSGVIAVTKNEHGIDSPATWFRENGWEHSAYSDSAFKRCASCAALRPYAWMEQLDAERVHRWMSEQPDPGAAFMLNELKELL